MIVTIFGATGLVGKELITHCKAKGYTVRAFGRNVATLIDQDLRDDAFEAIKGSLFDTNDILKAITGADAVLSAIGGPMEANDVTRSLGMKNIVAQMEKIGLKRIIAVGGMGVLNDANEQLIMDDENFPAAYMDVSKEHLKAYEHLKKSALDYTFVCPPNIVAKEADGLYTTIANYAAAGMQINAGNLAAFMVLELTRKEFVHQKVGIANS
jgi:uncharacterized protein